ncbi:MAG: DUF5050 domain-containing protein [Lachnospiraceae bacterium]|nr:DUF5050 domain-containing protein [Lachnospiraceae bacterium]
MSKKTKQFLIVFLTIFFVFLLAVIALNTRKIKLNDSNVVGNTAGNLNNGGLFCEKNGLVYFSNPYDGGALYSMKPDGTDIKRLLSAKVKFISADENHLYYYQQSASGTGGLGYIRSTFGMYRTSLNGRNGECLSQDVIFDMQLLGNYIYYTTTSDDGPEFRKVKIDESENVLLYPAAINPSCATTEQIYYNGVESNHYLYSWNPNTDTSSVVWQGNIWDPVYDNGYIYYLDVANDYRLCRYSLSEDQIEILTHDRVDCFNVGCGYIYYQANSATAPALKMMSVNGGNAQVVASGNYTAINMTSRYVFFKLFGEEAPLYMVPIGSTSVSTFDAAMQAAMEYMDK